MSLSTPNKEQGSRRRFRLLFELVLFAILADLMFCSKIIMEVFPNIHLLGMLTMTYTLVFRVKALIPIYIYVFLNGLYAGFDLWWVPYLYIWTILWGLTMLLPKRMPKLACAIVFPLLCGLHGFAFGILYSPAQTLMFGYDLETMWLWIMAGLPFDLLHGVGNILVGLLILPFATLLQKLLRRTNLY